MPAGGHECLRFEADPKSGVDQHPAFALIYEEGRATSQAAVERRFSTLAHTSGLLDRHCISSGFALFLSLHLPSIVHTFLGGESSASIHTSLYTRRVACVSTGAQDAT